MDTCEKTDTPVNTTSTKTAKAIGALKGSQNHRTHGLYVYKAVLDGDGLDIATNADKQHERTGQSFLRDCCGSGKRIYLLISSR